MPNIKISVPTAPEHKEDVVITKYGEWKEVRRNLALFLRTENDIMREGYIIKQVRKVEFFCGGTRINDSGETRYIKELCGL